jgi:hypothetical protein
MRPTALKRAFQFRKSSLVHLDSQLHFKDIICGQYEDQLMNCNKRTVSRSANAASLSDVVLVNLCLNDSTVDSALSLSAVI